MSQPPTHDYAILTLSLRIRANNLSYALSSSFSVTNLTVEEPSQEQLCAVLLNIIIVLKARPNKPPKTIGQSPSWLQWRQKFITATEAAGKVKGNTLSCQEHRARGEQNYGPMLKRQSWTPPGRGQVSFSLLAMKSIEMRS